MFSSAYRTLRLCKTQAEPCIHCSMHRRMTTSLDDLLTHLETVIQHLNGLKEAEEIELASEHLAWEQLSKIEELFVDLFE